jgi:glycosyltransferase involved in cell wall biosynthesis
VPSPKARPIRVAIDARLATGERGGVEQFIAGLAFGLSSLDGDTEEYHFLVNEGHDTWLRPLLSGPSSLLVYPADTANPSLPATGLGVRNAMKRALPHPVLEALRRRRDLARALGPSTGFIESSGIDVMHFSMQTGFLTSIPSVFSPQDLQHIHLSDFFSKDELSYRETVYRGLCRQAAAVTVMTSWGKRDIVEAFGLPPEQVQVTPYAGQVMPAEPPSGPEMDAVRARLGLPPSFALYPAKTWPHKNHRRLIEAIALLRGQSFDAHLVLTGHQGGRERQLLDLADTLGVSDLVHFTGMVSSVELSALYSMSRLLVFPSLFEGWGMPIIEAFRAGLPVACSSATCLPDITAGSATLFDPTDPSNMADAISRTWRDEALRERLIERGRHRAALFSWPSTARIFRACYRLAAGTETDEDRVLLSASPVV